MSGAAKRRAANEVCESHDAVDRTQSRDPRSGYHLVEPWPVYPLGMQFEGTVKPNARANRFHVLIGGAAHIQGAP